MKFHQKNDPMGKRALAIFQIVHLVFFATLNSVASDTLPSIPANTHVKRMSDYLSLKLSLTNNAETFLVISDGVNYDFRPNSKTATRLSFNYRFVSFSLGIAPEFLPGNKDSHLKGKSRFTNYSLAFNFNHWAQSLAFTRTKGYYLDNTKDFAPGWQPGIDPYVQLPNLVYQSFHGQTAYKFNKNFSFNAVSVQTERQLRSAGTFMPNLSYRYYFLEDRSARLSSDSAQDANNLEFILSAPYYYTFVLKKQFYVSAGLSPGIGLQVTTVRNSFGQERKRTTHSGAVYRFEAGLGLGYNGERFFGGLQFQAANIAYGDRNTDDMILNTRAAYQLFFGYRFVAPKIVKKAMDYGEEKKNRFLQKF